MTTLTMTPFQPARKHKAATADQYFYLRNLGYGLIAGDADQGGYWLSRGMYSIWFASAGDAARAVMMGRLPQLMVLA